MSRGKTATPSTFVVLNGINFPPRGQRREPGETVEASELDDKALQRLLGRGHIAPVDVVTKEAAEIIGLHFQDGLRASAIKATGKSGAITKADVKRALGGHR